MDVADFVDAVIPTVGELCPEYRCGEFCDHTCPDDVARCAEHCRCAEFERDVCGRPAVWP